jgi:hypothetical protein
VIVSAVSGVKFFKGEPILYLVGAIILGLLSWTVIEQTVRVQTIAYYINEKLTPKIRKASSDHNLTPLEYHDWTFESGWRNIITIVISWAKFVLGLLVSLIFCLFFLYDKLANNQYWTGLERILFIIVLLSLILPLLFGAISALTLYKKA